MMQVMKLKTVGVKKIIQVIKIKKKKNMKQMLIEIYISF